VRRRPGLPLGNAKAGNVGLIWGHRMKCKSCGARFSQAQRVGPGGNASPGQYSSVAFLFSVAAIAVGVFVGTGDRRFDLFTAAFLCLFAGYLLMLALFKSGYQEPTVGYHGSKCPECGARNWIWPWSF
jgi:hypothetical protein